jgi:hypothetical protein
MSEAEYLVGIDLGTSNCAIAFVELRRGLDAPVLDFNIPQLVHPGETAALALLPSCIYLPGEHELPPELTRLPWGAQEGGIVGEYARWRGARVPGRLVASAKSWLCHPGVDRSAPILPWGAVPDAPKISPVTASSRLVAHMARAWNAEHPGAPLEDQDVVITVPASFDEVARALTVQAAQAAGLEKFILLEEPQAAFYDFTSRHRHGLASALEGIRLILVVDVGGGTSDFTLVQAGDSPEGPALRRIAVGEHLMLGGDNMDAALSRIVEERMLRAGRRLSMTQWNQLIQVARIAKEELLSPENNKHAGRRNRKTGPEVEGGYYNLSIASEGSRLVGGTLTARISRAEAEQVVLDGFFPACGSDATPQRAGRMALQEVGLPYAQDPAVTRHLAVFLRAHATAARAALGDPADTPGLPRPDGILLNGGVFKSASITGRLLEVLSSWWPQAPSIPLLKHDSLDLAVARGAAFYGLVKRGLGRRIGGGSAHALFVGLEKAGTNQPMALCVIPRGQEEGKVVDVGGRTFQLSLGEPVRFPIFSTASDRLERAGDVVPVSDDLHALPPIHTLLKGGEGGAAAVPVHLQAVLTEIGTLELWCASNKSTERWRLEFELRGVATEDAIIVTQAMAPSLADARHWIEKIFSGKTAVSHGRGEFKREPPNDVKQLWSALERTLGPREDWPLSVLRELWSVVLAGAARRRRSADHERVFFQLIGYTLRPGFGYPLDDWRCEQSAKLFTESIQFHNDRALWKEFWVMWRRVAGGLSATRHQEIWSYLRPFMAIRVPPRPVKQLAKPKGVQPEGTDEMARLAAGLEHLAWQEKVELGDWITERLLDPARASGPWTWTIGRLGARVPIYGSVHQTVPPQKAAEWVTRLLEPQVIRLEGALFALAQLARLTGDRTRDLDEAARAHVLNALQQGDASPSWKRMVSEAVALEAKDKARALGDTLPVGLVLP